MARLEKPLPYLDLHPGSEFQRTPICPERLGAYKSVPTEVDFYPENPQASPDICDFHPDFHIRHFSKICPFFIRTDLRVQKIFAPILIRSQISHMRGLSGVLPGPAITDAKRGIGARNHARKEKKPKKGSKLKRKEKGGKKIGHVKDDDTHKRKRT